MVIVVSRVQIRHFLADCQVFRYIEQLFGVVFAPRGSGPIVSNGVFTAYLRMQKRIETVAHVFCAVTTVLIS